jgi:hypothetical protein
MRELIAEQVKVTFSKAIRKFKKKADLEDGHLSILLKLNDLDAVDESNNKAYVKVLSSYVCHNHKLAHEVKLSDIMGMTLTLSGIGSLVQAHIHTILEQFENEYSTNDVEVSVYSDMDDDDAVVYYVYANGELKKQFELLDVLKI